MLGPNRRAKVNVKVLVILIVVVVGLGISLVVARQVRRNILSERDFAAGTAAFEKGDWSTAYKHFQEYLGRNPDDTEILKKYAQARLAVRPLEPGHIGQAMAAYRRIIQLDPLEDTPYEKLAMLYAGMGNFEDLAYIAGKRLEHEPNDLDAPLWQAEALVQLNRTKDARETLSKLIERLEADPQDHIEYVQACAQMSSIESAGNQAGSTARALEWLNKAVSRFPESVEALAARARFYRLAPTVPDADQAQRRELARQDLTKADEIGTNDPRIRLFLAREWMAYGEFEKVAAELEAADQLSEEALEERYFDLNTWVVDRFGVASELALRTGNLADGVALATETLARLEERGHRISVLPAAIRLYIASGGEANVAEAGKGLKEYEDALYVMQKANEAKLELAYLRALVARAQGDSYTVIEALQPIVAAGSGHPELLRLLGEAFSRTDQPRRAIDAMLKYLRNRPDDLGMVVRLTREYLRMQDWPGALEMARLAQSLNPLDIGLKLLRIEAGIHVAAEKAESPDMAQLEELRSELSTLREDETNAKRVDIRILQAIIGVYLAGAQTDAAVKEQKLANVESELKLAIEECDAPLRAEMQLVKLHLQMKQTDKAIEACRAACDRHPETAEPWLLLAGLHVANGDPNSAIRSLEEADATVVSEWDKRSITIRRALLELMHGNRATGVDLLSEMAARDPKDIRARTLLLDIREVRADQAKAEELVKQLQEAEGQNGLMWRLYRASTWLSSERWRSSQQETVDLLQYCIDADPEWVAPPLLLVQLYEKLGDTKRVEETCRQALVRNSSAMAIADKLITLLERQGRLSDAEDIRQRVEADPRVASAWNVNAALRAGDSSRAIDELRLRISNDDRDVESRILLARLLYWQTHDAERALGYLDEAEAITSRSLATVGVRAAILKAEGQGDRAQQILDEYVDDKGDFNAYLMRASYYISQGQPELAEADYKRLIAFPDKDQQRTAYALLSDFYSRQNRVDEAVQTLEEGLNADPSDLVLQRMLMKRLFMRGQDQDRDRALVMLATLEEKLRQDPDLMQVRAMELLRQGDVQSVQAATSKLEEVVKLNPTAVDAYRTLINLAMRAQEYEAARGYAIRAMGANPKHPLLLSARGRAEVALGNAQIATELARLALVEDPNSAEALGVLVDVAITTADEGLLKAAIESVRKIPDSDPNRDSALQGIVGKAMESRNPTLLTEVRGLIESELRRSPSDGRMLLARAEVLVGLGAPAEAIPELAAYCKSESGAKNLDAVITLVDLYRLTGDLDQAYEWLERAEELAPKSQTVVHARFLCWLTEERFDELTDISSSYIVCSDQNPASVTRAASILTSMDSTALKGEGIKLFEHAAQRWPALMTTRLELASALYQVGDVEKAKKTYKALREEYPENIRILNDYAWILQEHDRSYDAALELAEEGLRIEPEDLHLLDTRGVVLSKMTGRLADAKADFETLVRLSPVDSPRQARSHLQLGRVCVQLDDFAGARDHLEKAQEIDRKSPVLTAEERTEIAQLLQQSGM